MKEASIMHRVMLKLTEIGVRVSRNNVGQCKMDNGSVVRFGVGGPGGSDLIGFTPYTVRKSDVGRELAIFTAVEVKRPGGKVTPEQQQFLSAVEAAGGVAVVAYEADEAVAEVMRKTQRV